MNERRLLTVKEACAYAKMSQSRLYLKLKAGEIRAFKREHQTLIDAASIDEYTAKHFEPWLPEKERLASELHQARSQKWRKRS